MSYVTFAAPNGSVEVKGFERARASHICIEMTLMMMDEPRVLSALLPPGESLKQFFESVHVTDREYLECHDRLRSYLGGSPSNTFWLPDGQKITAMAVTLNTALRLGNDVIQFLARFHGQCELHAYVEGPNRFWLANMLKKGLLTKALSSDAGWEDVINLLVENASQPVVTSYSMSRGFPDPTLTEYDEKSWEAMSFESQWHASLVGLREIEVELNPGNWESYSFETGHSIMNLLELCRTGGGS